MADLARDRARQIRDEESARQERIAAIGSSLPKKLARLRKLSARAAAPEEAIAINTSILELAAADVVALNRLGRACAAIGRNDQARRAFVKALDIDPHNRIASRRLHQLEKEQ